MSFAGPARGPDGSAPVVVVVGDVMVDVVVRPVGPWAPNSDTPSAVDIAPGGSAANQAVALARAGARAHLVASVGDDPLGQAAAAALAGSGVDVHLSIVSGVSTGVVVAMVSPSGQRSMFTDRGANLALAPSSLPQPLFRPGRHLHLSGYVLLDDANRAAGLAAWRLAGEVGMTRSVDSSSAGPLAGVGGDAFLEWTAGADLIFCNLDEGEVLSGRQGHEDVLGYLSLRCGQVVLTLGEQGALFSAGGGTRVHQRAQARHVADTTGAGDAHTGTFLSYYLAGQGPEPALAAAARAAAAAVERAGARSW